MAGFVLEHAYVLTMDAGFRLIEDGAVAVENGQVMAVGASAEVAARYPDWPRENLQGKALMPGLVNCHTHLPMSLFRGMADDKELMDWLTHYIFPVEAAALNPEFVRWGTRLSLWEMLRGGTTSLVDMYMFESVIAEECERVGIRAVLGQALLDFPTPEFSHWEAMIEGTRWLVERYRNHPLIVPALGPHSPYTVSPEHLRECQKLSEEWNCPVVIHLAETRSEHDRVLSERGQPPVTYLDGLGLLSRRTIAAHVVWPEEAEIPLLAQRGVGVGHCPQSNAKLASGIAPVVKMIRAGVHVGLGTDGCASNNDLDLWQEMQTANFLQKLHCQDATVLSAAETLRMATIEGARAAHLDHLVGSLEVGKRADMIVVRLDGSHQIPVYDPVSQLCYATKSSDVEKVYIEGKLVMDQGRVPTINESELRLGVAEQSAKVRAILKRSST